MASRLNATVVVLEVLSFLPPVIHIGLSHQGPATSRCSGFQTQGTQGGGTRSGEARGPECAGNSTSTLAGTKFPAGVDGTKCGFGLWGVCQRRRNRCSSNKNNKRKRSTSFRERSRWGTRRCSRLRKPTGDVARFARSSAGSVPARDSRPVETSRVVTIQ